MLRYTNNTLYGKVNNISDVSQTFGSDVDSIGYTNNSSGYFIGLEGFSTDYISENYNFNEMIFGSGLFDSNSTPTSIQGSFDDSTFDSMEFDNINTNSAFIGQVAYCLIYERYITDLEYQGIYTSLDEILATRGISLS
jgi:hypothetical protein